MSACSSITLAAKTIADISVDIGALGTTVIQSLLIGIQQAKHSGSAHAIEFFKGERVC